MLSMNIIQEGEKPWIVMLHGLCGNSTMFTKQVSVVSKEFNICMIDLPSHGKSTDTLESLGCKTIEDVSDVVVRELREKGIFSAIFMGVSLGTLVIAGIIKKYKDMVVGCIMCGAVEGVNLGVSLVLSVVDSVRLLLPNKGLLHVASHIMMPNKGHKLSREFFIKSGEKLGKKEFYDWVHMIIKNKNILRNIEINIPCMYILGDEDYAFKTKVIKRLKTRAADLRIIEHCGHVCNLQKVKEYNMLVESFLMNLYGERYETRVV